MKPVNTNAADQKQLKEAKKKERLVRRDQLDDIRFLLQFKQFRRLVWRFLEFCNVFSSIWRPSAEIHHLSGKQDVGHFIMGEVTDASPEAFLMMMKESKEGDLDDAASEPGHQSEPAAEPGSEQAPGPTAESERG